MKNMSIRAALIAALLLVLAAFAQPAAAASRNVTITEQQINSSYAVTNPKRSTITNRTVDLQPGQVVISATWSAPRRDPVNIVSVYTPALENGRVAWTLASATANGEPASAELQQQINAQLSSSWARYIKGKNEKATVSSVTITDNEIVYAVEAAR